MDHYLSIFVESAWGASIVPFASEATLAAMQAFGGFNLPLAAGLAVAGATLGQAFNWWLGSLMLAAQRRGAKVLPPATYDKASAFFGKYLVFLIFFCWLPLFKFVVLAAGLLGVRARTALVLIACGNALHYGPMLI